MSEPVTDTGVFSKAIAYELERANLLRQALFDISELSRSDTEISAFYRELQRILGTLMYAENFIIATQQPDSDQIRFEFCCDSMDPAFTAEAANASEPERLIKSLTAWAIRQGRLCHLVPSDIERIHAEEGIPQWGRRSIDWLAAPLRGRDGAFGVVIVQSFDDSIRFDAQDEQLLTFVCDHVAAALEQRAAERALRDANDELEDRVRRRTEALEREIERRRDGEKLQRALFRIARLATEPLGLDEFYRQIHLVIADLIYARNMFIALADERRKLMEFVYYEDEVDESSDPLPIPEPGADCGPTMRIYFSGEPYLWLASEAPMPPGATGAPSYAWLGVPLHAGDRVIGVLAVQSYDPAIEYEEADKGILTFVAQHVGTTIDRRRAKVALQRANDELERRVADRTRSLELANNELRSTLEALENTQEQLVETEKMASLGGLVAGVAHEINTPLGVALTAASHLERQIGKLLGKSLSAEELSRAMEGLAAGPAVLVRENLTRAAGLVNSFRQVAVDQSGEERRLFNFTEYVGEVVVSIRPEVRRQGHVLELVGPEDVPVDGYPFAVYPIVSQLVRNSLAHAFGDDEHGTLRIEIEADDDWVTLTYSDDGRGMTDEDLRRIFEPFFTTQRGRGGTGLGMHIVYNHVIRLGGKVRALPRAERGLAIIIRLPRHMREL